MYFFIIACLVSMMVPVACTAISNMGWIQVQSNIDGASVYFDGKYQGMTNDGQLVVTVYMAAPVQAFTVEKPGFTTARGTITMPDAGETTSLYARLRPVPVPAPSLSHGSLSVDSFPQGAKIYLNGYFRGIAPFTLDDVTPGSYTIDAVLNGYNPYATMVRISPGSRTNITCLLRSGSSLLNSVFVTSDPPNAFVYIDNVYSGETPLTINDIGTGDHIIELYAPGYVNWNTTVNLKGGVSYTVYAKMVSQKTGEYVTSVTIPASPAPTPATTKAGVSLICVILAPGIVWLVAGIRRKQK